MSDAEVIELAKILAAASQYPYATGSGMGRRAFENQARAALEAGYSRPAGEHDHEFEECCVICGKTWHEVQSNG